MNATRFEALFRLWYSPLCRYAFRMLGDKQEAEDLVQEVFVKIWDQKDNLDIRFEKTYLFQAVHNAALNLLTKRKKIKLVSDEDVINKEGSSNPEEIFQWMETEKSVELGLQALPTACREVFLLSRYEGMSYKEIALVLQISIKTVEAQMSKALKVLRRHILAFACLFSGLIHLIFSPL